MKIIGIDFGTSNTYLFGSLQEAEAAHYARASRPEAIQIPGISEADGGITTAVLYRDDAPFLIGQLAESEYHVHPRPGYVLRSQFKPELAQADSNAQRWTADFLRILRENLPPGCLEADTQIFAGIPAQVREDFSLNLAACFERAGWPKPRMVRESDAALISCLQSGLLAIDDLENELLILDFGGGTCDYTLLAGLDLLDGGGDALYGGRLFDDLFFQAFCAKNASLSSGGSDSPFAWYLHWVACKAEKERFSQSLASGAESASLHLVWHDTRQGQHDAWLHDYSREDLIRAAENFRASPDLLRMLSGYAGRGGLSPEARELLEGKNVGLISWLRSMLLAIRGRQRVGRVILSGGSSHWPFVGELARDIFPQARCSLSPHSYVDIAYGLALYPALLASRGRVEKLLEQGLQDFLAQISALARDLLQKNAAEVARLCTKRIVECDLLPALEWAQKQRPTVAELEKAFEKNIRSDSGLTDIVRQKSDSLHRELEQELKRRFSAWLKNNGVALTPGFEFPARAISDDFFKGLNVSLGRLDSLNLMKFTITHVLPLLAGTATAGALAHGGEPVSALVGGGAVFGGTWLAGRFAPGFLEKRRLPGFLLSAKLREKIIAKNKIYLEKALSQAFAAEEFGLCAELEPRLRQSLKTMLARLNILNQVDCRRA